MKAISKAKNFAVTLSSDFLSISSNGTAKKVPYDASKKVVTFTGERIIPQIASVTIDGGTYVPVGTLTTSDAFKNAAGTYQLVITDNADGKVGTVKYEIRIKYTKGKQYVAGGSKAYSFKINAQDGLGLVLQK